LKHGSEGLSKLGLFTVTVTRFLTVKKNILRNRKFAYIRNQIVADKRNFTMKRDVFQAIADPTRRAILTLIAIQAMTPNALAEHFDMTRQAVSKHIQVLRESELIKQKQEGREIYYLMQPKKLKEVDRWLETFRNLWEERFNNLDQLLKKIKK